MLVSQRKWLNLPELRVRIPVLSSFFSNLGCFVTSKLILASSSPFRKALLDRLGLDFIQVSPDIDETALPHESPTDLVKRLGILKAKEVAKTYLDALIIASDQVALCQDKVLGKPGSYDKAVAQLTSLSGQTACFYTSLVLLNAKTQRVQSELATTEVTFRNLTSAQIEHYLKIDKPYGCAGSFKSEALGVALFTKMKSDDPDALIGLPLIKLVGLLANEGLDPLGTC